jgi:hypothetical protein
MCKTPGSDQRCEQAPRLGTQDKTQSSCPYGGVDVLNTSHRHKTGQLNIKRPGSPEVQWIVPPHVSAAALIASRPYSADKKRGAS